MPDDPTSPSLAAGGDSRCWLWAPRLVVVQHPRGIGAQRSGFLDRAIFFWTSPALLVADAQPAARPVGCAGSNSPRVTGRARSVRVRTVPGPRRIDSFRFRL